MIYLDHNSSTIIYPEVKKMMIDWLEYPSNASSVHTFGRKAKMAIEKSRQQIAKLLGINNHPKNWEITFTSSATESNNLIISNYLDGEIFISEIEHPSITSYIKTKRNNIQLINIDNKGTINLNDLEKKLEKSYTKKKLVVCMLAHNESGIIQPLGVISKIAHKFGAKVHSDCSQACGKIKINLIDLGVDFISLSAHKFGGPSGSGVLVSKLPHNLMPLIVGGGQEKNLRSGTENALSIVGCGYAAEIIDQKFDIITNRMLKIRNHIEYSIINDLKHTIIVGLNNNRLPNTSLIINPNKKAETVVIALDLKGIAVSAGSACSSGKVKISPLLKLMGYSDLEANSAIRVSIGHNNTEEDANHFLKAYKELNYE